MLCQHAVTSRLTCPLLRPVTPLASPDCHHDDKSHLTSMRSAWLRRIGSCWNPLCEACGRADLSIGPAKPIRASGIIH